MKENRSFLKKNQICACSQSNQMGNIFQILYDSKAEADKYVIILNIEQWISYSEIRTVGDEKKAN